MKGKIHWISISTSKMRIPQNRNLSCPNTWSLPLLSKSSSSTAKDTNDRWRFMPRVWMQWWTRTSNFNNTLHPPPPTSQQDNNVSEHKVRESKQILVHSCSQQHYSQQPKDRTNLSVCPLTDKQNVVYTHNGISLSPKKGGDSDTW